AYEDKSHDFVIKTAPVAELLKKAAGIAKGSANQKTTKVGHISKAKLREIAEYKMPDLNCNDIEAALKVIEGSARNMGITIDED
ncbi:MAG: 50S ribosomal protein L11, partial [Bacilli bacterium]